MGSNELFQFSRDLYLIKINKNKKKFTLINDFATIHPVYETLTGDNVGQRSRDPLGDERRTHPSYSWRLWSDLMTTQATTATSTSSSRAPLTAPAMMVVLLWGRDSGGEKQAAPSDVVGRRSVFNSESMILLCTKRGDAIWWRAAARSQKLAPPPARGRGCDQTSEPVPLARLFPHCK